MRLKLALKLTQTISGDHVQQVRPDPLVPDGVTLETEHLLLPRGLGDTISAGGGAGEVL